MSETKVLYHRLPSSNFRLFRFLFIYVTGLKLLFYNLSTSKGKQFTSCYRSSSLFFFLPAVLHTSHHAHNGFQAKGRQATRDTVVTGVNAFQIYFATLHLAGNTTNIFWVSWYGLAKSERRWDVLAKQSWRWKKFHCKTLHEHFLGLRIYTHQIWASNLDI